MTPPVFLYDGPLPAGDELRLTGPEGRHAAVVRRLRPGERLDVTDGAGALARCTVLAVEGETVVCAVHAIDRVPPPDVRLVVVQALAKGGRDEDAVAAMTEVGVDAVVPWQAARSVARWRDRSHERWAATAREAAKQSRRSRLADVSACASTAQVASLLSAAALGVVLHEDAGTPLASVRVPAAGEVVVVVGPEGGISDAELATFRAAGAAVCRLGETVLRTSTAGVAALSVLSVRVGRWS